MIKVITKDNIDEIKNEKFKNDAMRYVEMYESFLEELLMTGVTLEEEDNSIEREKLVSWLKSNGVHVNNDGKSFVYGNVSPSCIDCRTGDGSATYIISLKCNRDCYFCTNKNQYDYAFNKDTVRDIISQFNKSLGHYKKMRSVAITGGEPLLFPNECIKFIKHVKKAQKTIQTRIYTNGDLATVELMQTLAKAGLDEIRFGIKLDDNGNPDKDVMESVRLAVGIIPRVVVEMPAVPKTVDSMKKLFDELNSYGIFSINLLEFLFPWTHINDYITKGYKIVKRPYRVLFDYSYAGGIPVAGSDIECLELLKHAVENKYKTGIHYCTLENKLTAQVWHHNRKLNISNYEYFSPNDFFIKSVKAYGDDAQKVYDKLSQEGCKGYMYNKVEQVIEFPMQDVAKLKGMNIPLGLSYMILDREDDKTFVREVAINMTDSESFDINLV